MGKGLATFFNTAVCLKPTHFSVEFRDWATPDDCFRLEIAKWLVADGLNMARILIGLELQSFK